MPLSKCKHASMQVPSKAKSYTKAASPLLCIVDSILGLQVQVLTKQLKKCQDELDAAKMEMSKLVRTTTVTQVCAPVCADC